MEWKTSAVTIYIYTLWTDVQKYVFFVCAKTLMAAINLVSMKNHKFPLE